ncbi:MAG: hypothetical protein Q8P57_03395 [Candidatus Pacearchaeota archaeon]|nr:hypothetical protein [Candidatus Pacearchaeota archaeon]
MSKLTNALKKAGLAGLTIASPPIGGAVIGALSSVKGEKIIATVVGLFSGGLLSMVALSGDYIFTKEETLYTNPETFVMRDTALMSDEERDIPKYLTFPIASFFNTQPITYSLTEDSKYIKALGDDVIQFDSQTGRYKLNMDESRIVDAPNDNLGFFSLRDMQNTMHEASARLESITQTGNTADLKEGKEILEKAREAREELDEARKEYEEGRESYTGVEEHFKYVVDQMNLELGKIRSEIKNGENR